MKPLPALADLQTKRCLYRAHILDYKCYEPQGLWIALSTVQPELDCGPKATRQIAEANPCCTLSYSL